MRPAIASATAIQTLSPLTLGLLEDIGWRTSLVDPDPPSWTAPVSPTGTKSSSVVSGMYWIWSQASDLYGLRTAPYFIQLSGAPALSGGNCGTFSSLPGAYTKSLSTTITSATLNACYRLSVFVEDKHGNRTPTVTGATWIYDTTPPTATLSIVESSPQISVSGSTVYLGTPSAGQSFAVTYSVTDVSAIAVGCGTLAGFSAQVSGTGMQRTCTYTALGSGYAAASVTSNMLDDALNASTTPAFSVVLDTIAPSALVTLSENAPTLFVLGVAQLYVSTPLTGTTFTATYSVSETGSGVASITCPAVAGFTSQAGGSGNTRTCTYTATGGNYATGVSVAVVTDNAGNSSDVQSFSVTRDVTPPTAAVSLQILDQTTLYKNQQTLYVGTPAAAATYTASYTVSDPGSGLAAATCPAVAGFTVQQNITMCTYTASGSGYASGSFAITATFSDQVGNAAQASYTFTRDTTPPTATVAPYDVDPAIHVSGTTAYVGTPTAGGNLSAKYQITETGSGFLSISCPAIAGFSLNGSIGSATTQDCVWSALGSGYAGGTATVQLADNVGNTGPASFTVVRDTTPPTLTFSNAGAGTITRTTTSVDLQWTEGDTGAGVQGRSIQRQRASLTGPGQCPGAGGTWTNEGSPITGGSPATASSLSDATCYRWVASITDNVNNSGSSTSPTYLIDLTPAAATVTLAENAASLHADATTLFVGNAASSEAFTATFGLVSGTASSVSCPTIPGFDLSAGPGNLTCTYLAKGSGYTSGAVTATVTAANSLQSSAPFTITVDTTVPAIGFTKPQAAFSIRKAPNVDLEWTESETGSGIASRRLQQQVAQIVTPGTCDGVTWADDGAAVTGGSPKTATGLTDGRCYRWTQATRDQVGNLGSATSGVVLVDGSAPGLALTLGSSSGGISVVGDTVTVIAPAAGATFTGSAQVTEAASGFAGLVCPDVPGFTKGKSGAFPTITCTWNATGSGYQAASPVVTATDQAGNEGSATFQVLLGGGATLDPLPAGWASRDIGTVGLAGSAGVLSGSDVFQVTGAGRGFSGASDSFRLTSRAMTGDGSFAARIVSQAAPTAKGLVGVMVRQGTTAAAPFVFVGRKADGAIVVVRRTAAGATAVTTTVAGVAATVPVEFRVRRTGSTLLAQYRRSGGAWTRAASVTVTLASTTRAGIAVTSRSTTSLSTVTWDSVTFVP